jgi:isopenicillin N synthase-like dioxygenase
MSNGKYKSVEHRAVVNAKRDRLSVATFLDPAKNQIITPAPALLNAENPKMFKNILFQDFIAAWYSKGPSGKRNIDNLVLAS